MDWWVFCLGVDFAFRLVRYSWFFIELWMCNESPCLDKQALDQRWSQDLNFMDSSSKGIGPIIFLKLWVHILNFSKFMLRIESISPRFSFWFPLELKDGLVLVAKDGPR